MRVTIEIQGPKGDPRKRDIQKNIDDVQRMIDRSSASEHTLIDTKSILIAIQKQLPN